MRIVSSDELLLFSEPVRLALYNCSQFMRAKDSGYGIKVATGQ